MTSQWLGADVQEARALGAEAYGLVLSGQHPVAVREALLGRARIGLTLVTRWQEGVWGQASWLLFLALKALGIAKRAFGVAPVAGGSARLVEIPEQDIDIERYIAFEAEDNPKLGRVLPVVLFQQLLDCAAVEYNVTQAFVRDPVHVYRAVDEVREHVKTLESWSENRQIAIQTAQAVRRFTQDEMLVLEEDIPSTRVFASWRTYSPLVRLSEQEIVVLNPDGVYRRSR